MIVAFSLTNRPRLGQAKGGLGLMQHPYEGSEPLQGLFLRQRPRRLDVHIHR